MKFLKKNWSHILFISIVLLASISMLVLFDPKLAKQFTLLWNSAGAKAVVVFFLTYGLYCIFIGIGDETDIIGLIPAVCIGAISYVLFDIPLLGNIVGIILGLLVLSIVLDRMSKYLRHRKKTKRQSKEVIS